MGAIWNQSFTEWGIEKVSSLSKLQHYVHSICVRLNITVTSYNGKWDNVCTIVNVAKDYFMLLSLIVSFPSFVFPRVCLQVAQLRFSLHLVSTKIMAN